jgi:hypothetical protein
MKWLARGIQTAGPRRALARALACNRQGVPHNCGTQSHKEPTNKRSVTLDTSLEDEILGQKEVIRMPTPLENALAYLEQLEADRRAAIALSEQKALEAKLIKARQEGFRAAMEMLGAANPVGNSEAAPEESRRRRVRRNISQLILRELSFSGAPMTTTQIAKAIDYIPERTESVLKGMAESGKVLRGKEGRWTIEVTSMAQHNSHAALAAE